ncbi:MAG: hypothetical protein H7X89_03835 [Rhizobiales bacterium]|nr:hypothetical protein [Hyphomicrobiales bacterium]
MRASIEGPALSAPGLALPSADAYLSARGMIKNFGDDAENHARQSAQAYARRGDSEASAIWLAIATAIDTLRRNPAASAERRKGA